MRLIIFGATGRTGSCVLDQAKALGHEVTAFVRDKSKFKRADVKSIVGDVRNPEDVTRALSEGFDAVVVCIGNTALKPSTIVTEGYRAIISAMKKNKLERLVGVSGSAEMPNKTILGKLYTRLLRLTPVGHAIRDHDSAFKEISASGLKWTLAGCNYIPDGTLKREYKTELSFPGGFKVIRPPDIADFLLRELDQNKFVGQVVGIWY